MVVCIALPVSGVDAVRLYQRINMMKGSLSNKEFIELCIKVTKYNKHED